MIQSFTAFVGRRHLISGNLAEVALAVKRASQSGAPIVIFNDATGRSLDLDLRGSDEEIVEELFLAALSRFPTGEERARALEYVAGKGKKNRPRAFADVLWALVNTAEFIFNH